ncbi:hypothetical protein Cob_v004519 [Colletotrichum orbiculare MAFF 240422]|uniref:Uncharacterized protein n=3 Tax=Colletotrichum orbiculare species complex TaxID=2707354 RepID=N4USJ1_COLOR|nr:hypothetical protein Cob_v004519 [Colletotrichum orbiculare MAFF 240422]TDZ29817.1 hypothetical protein C8035_v004006 [Colletotrichum spinosum]TDZ74285.1 hypothetical protein CTRI78_v001008 [Colletotrichum trifolii]
MSALQSFSKWLHLKQYQLEVTFSVYIFTPLEKFIFYTVLFLLCSLTFIATILYLPQHITFIANRAWFYMHGDPIDAVVEAVVDAVEVTKAAVESVLMAETTRSSAAALAHQTVELVKEL